MVMGLTVVIKTFLVFLIYFQINILNLHSMCPVFTARKFLIFVRPDVNIRLIFLILVFMYVILTLLQCLKII